MRHSLMPSAQAAPHYGVLLLVLLVLLVVAPLLPTERAGYGVEILFDLVLVTGAYSAAWQSRHRLPFFVLTGATLATRWTDMVLDHSGFSLASIALLIVWLGYAVALILTALFRMREVGTNAILGAIVAYVLTAVAFASLYLMVELIQPGSFTGLPAGGNQAELESALLYFSVVSITTMGYGDITPISGLARSLSSIEGMFGTLYLAVMIARLVGLHSSRPTDDASP
ncbi:MAG: potassium channel family protein [Polyangiales bacterium]